MSGCCTLLRILSGKPLSAGLFVTSSFKLISTLGAVSPNTAAVVFYILLMVGALAMGVYAYLKS